MRWQDAPVLDMPAPERAQAIAQPQTTGRWQDAPLVEDATPKQETPAAQFGKPHREFWGKQFGAPAERIRPQHLQDFLNKASEIPAEQQPPKLTALVTRAKQDMTLEEEPWSGAETTADRFKRDYADEYDLAKKDAYYLERENEANPAARENVAFRKKPLDERLKETLALRTPKEKLRDWFIEEARQAPENKYRDYLTSTAANHVRKKHDVDATLETMQAEIKQKFPDRTFNPAGTRKMLEAFELAGPIVEAEHPTARVRMAKAIPEGKRKDVLFAVSALSKEWKPRTAQREAYAPAPEEEAAITGTRKGVKGVGTLLSTPMRAIEALGSPDMQDVAYQKRLKADEDELYARRVTGAIENQDPLIWEGAPWYRKGTIGASETAPSMGAAMIGTVGAVAASRGAALPAAATWAAGAMAPFAITAGTAYDDTYYEILEQTGNRKLAGDAAAASGFAQALVEVIEVDPLTSSLSAPVKKALREKVLKKIVVANVKDFAKRYTKEMGEEFAQGVIDELIKEKALTSAGVETEGTRAAIMRGLQQGVDAGLPMLLLMGPGPAVRTGGSVFKAAIAPARERMLAAKQAARADKLLTKIDAIEERDGTPSRTEAKELGIPDAQAKTAEDRKGWFDENKDQMKEEASNALSQQVAETDDGGGQVQPGLPPQAGDPVEGGGGVPLSGQAPQVQQPAEAEEEVPAEVPVAPTPAQQAIGETLGIAPEQVEPPPKPIDPAKAKRAAEVQAWVDQNPFFEGATHEVDLEEGILTATRPDGHVGRFQFDADEMADRIGKRKGKPNVRGFVIFEGNEGKFREGDIIIHSKASQKIVNHEVAHWADKMGLATTEEVERLGRPRDQENAREGFAKEFADHLEGKRDDPTGVFGRIAQFAKQLFSAKERMIAAKKAAFDEIAARGKPAKKTNGRKATPAPAPVAAPTAAAPEVHTVESLTAQLKALAERTNASLKRAEGSRKYHEKEKRKAERVVSAEEERIEKQAALGLAPEDVESTDQWKEHVDEVGRYNQMVDDLMTAAGFKSMKDVKKAANKRGLDSEVIPDDATDVFREHWGYLSKYENKTGGLQGGAWEILQGGMRMPDQSLLKQIAAGMQAEDTSFDFGSNIQGEFATAEDAGPLSTDSTGLQRAMVDALREARGAAPIGKSPGESVEAWTRQAIAELTRDPKAGPDLVNYLRANPQAVLTKIQEAILNIMHRLGYNDYHAAMQRLMDANDAGNLPASAAAEASARVAEGAFDEIEKLATRAHSEMGRAFRAIQIRLKSDMSPDAVLRRWRKAKHGQPLSAEEFKDFDESTKKYAELEAELQVVQAQLAAKDGNLAAMEALIQDLTAKQDAIEAAEEAARKAKTSRVRRAEERPTPLLPKKPKPAYAEKPEYQELLRNALNLLDEEMGLEVAMMAEGTAMPEPSGKAAVGLRDWLASHIDDGGSLQEAQEFLAEGSPKAAAHFAEWIEKTYADLTAAKQAAAKPKPNGRKPKPTPPPLSQLGPMPPFPGEEIGQKTLGAPIAQRSKVEGSGAPIIPKERVDTSDSAGTGFEEPEYTDEQREAIRSLSKGLETLQAALANPQPKKTNGRKSPTTIREMQLKYEINELAKHINARQEKIRRQNAPPLVKLGLWVQEALDLARSTMLGFDFGITWAQGGLLLLGHPIKGFADLGGAIKAFFSKRGQFEVEEAIKNSPNFHAYEQMGIDFTEIGGRREMQDEYFQGQLAEQLPVLRNFARAFTTGMNMVRAHTADALIKNYAWASKATGKTATLDPAAAEILGNATNVFSGRGALNEWARKSMPIASQLFLAPRWVISRFQAALLQPLLHNLPRGVWAGRARAAVLAEYGRSIMGFSTLMALAKLAAMLWPKDDEENKPQVESDPRSPDFGQVRMGKTRLDMTAGLRAGYVFLTQMATGQRKEESGDMKKIDRVWKTSTFTRQKMSPVAGGSVDLLMRKDVRGKPVNVPSVVLRRTWPLWSGDAYENVRDQGMTRGAFLSLMASIGARTSTYSDEDDLVDRLLDNLGVKPEEAPKPKPAKKSNGRKIRL